MTGSPRSRPVGRRNARSHAAKCLPSAFSKLVVPASSISRAAVAGSETMVFLQCPETRPCRPVSRFRRATRLRKFRLPSVQSWARTRRPPWRHLESA